MKIEKILLPFDDSVHSQNAASFALDLAKRYSAHVTIIHCYEEWNANLTEIPERLIEEKVSRVISKYSQSKVIFRYWQMS